MSVIHKYYIGFPSTGTTVVSMPVLSKVLHFAMQHGRPTIWVSSLVGVPNENRRFVTIPTGCDIPAGHDYVGTALDGEFVWHLLEERGA